MIKKVQPKSVDKLFCSRCGELLVKLYPWHMFQLNIDKSKIICGRCVNKSTLKSK